ncbi:MAG: WG repeat-containing protein [Breznakibacter sp.]|nr:WG repeat-containing protein [Breznakibacter sp.]
MKAIYILISLFVLIPSAWADQSTKRDNDNHLILNIDSLRNQYERIWQLTPSTYRVMKNGKIGVADSTGAIIIPVEFNQIWDMDNNLNIKVLYNGKMGLYNLSGRIIINPDYDNIWPFMNGKAKVIKNGKIGYFSQEGKIIIPCEYQQIWDFENGRAKVLKEGLMGYINEEGLEVIPTIYQQIWNFSNGKARVIKNGRIGYINEAGIEVIPPIYSQIWEFEGDRAKAILDGKIIWIDTNGQPTTEPINNDESTEDYALATSEAIEMSQEEQTQTEEKIFNNRIEIIKNRISTNLNIHTQKKQKKERFKGHYFGVDIGYNSFVTSGLNFEMPEEYQFLDLNNGKSVAVAINLLQFNIGLNKKKNMGFVTGLGIEYNNYRFDSQYILTKDAFGKLSYYTSDRDVKKNKLTSTFLNIPLLYEYQLDIASTGDHAYFSAGPILGIRLKSHTKVKYYNSSSKDEKKSDFCLNDFRYGIMARVGYKAINLTASYYLSPLFYTDKGPELYPVSFSIGINLNI